MNVKQSLLEEGGCPPSKSGLRRYKASLRVVMLLIALIVTSEAVTLAQDCFDTCQQELASCLQFANGNPSLELRCQVQYDKCSEDCM